MAVPVLKSSFSAGELAPALWGQPDLAKYAAGASTMRNLFVSYRGGALSRAGTAYVGRSAQTGTINPPRLIPFQFSINQGYVLEFGKFYMRVIANGGFVLESAFDITGATQADPCRITASGNNFAVDDWVYIANVGGMTELNGVIFAVKSVSGANFTLIDLDGNNIDSTGYLAYTSGGTVARIYTLTTPYAAGDVWGLKYAQSADVMSLTHPNYAPQELSRLTAVNWTITALDPGGAVPVAPPNLAAVATNTTTTNPASYSYVVTSVDANGRESTASGSATVTNSVNMGGTAGSVNLTWDAVSNAVSYNVYRAPVTFGGAVPASQVYGYIGTTLGPIYTDTNTVPDFSQSPPQFQNPFAPGAILDVQPTSGGSGYTALPSWSITTSTGSGFNGYAVIGNGALTGFVITDAGQNYAAADTITFSGGGATSQGAASLTIGPATGTYPGCVAYFQSRRAYASTYNNPDTIFFSKPGDYTNFDTSIPTVDDDAITTTPWAEQVNGVNWMIPMPFGLIVGTGIGAWQINGPNSFGASQNPITPSNLQAIPQSQHGFNSQVPPIKINYDVVYMQGKGSIARDLQYNYFVSIYEGQDLTILSSHLFLGHTIQQWAYCEEPYKVIWAVRDDGVLLSLTYLKEQQVAGWARHDTNGSFVAVCSASEPPVDAAYFVVQRTVNGTKRFYIERMNNRIWNTVEDTWCVDCGLSYSGASTTTITNLGHLVGESVVGIADGVPVGPLTVSAAGTVTLPFAASAVKLGLNFTAQLQTLYLDAGQPTLQGRRKGIYAVTVRVTNSAGLKVSTNQPDGSAQSPPEIAVAWSNLTALPNLGASFTSPGGAAGVGLGTGDSRAVVHSDWLKPAQVAIEQDGPLPMEVIAVVPEFLPGDMPESEIQASMQRGRGAQRQGRMAA